MIDKHSIYREPTPEESARGAWVVRKSDGLMLGKDQYPLRYEENPTTEKESAPQEVKARAGKPKHRNAR